MGGESEGRRQTVALWRAQEGLEEGRISCESFGCS